MQSAVTLLSCLLLAALLGCDSQGEDDSCRVPDFFVNPGQHRLQRVMGSGLTLLKPELDCAELEEGTAAFVKEPNSRGEQEIRLVNSNGFRLSFFADEFQRGTLTNIRAYAVANTNDCEDVVDYTDSDSTTLTIAVVTDSTIKREFRSNLIEKSLECFFCSELSTQGGFYAVTDFIAPPKR